MKHYLSILCFALTLFFLMDKAAANLLLKQNPTLLEPDSFAVSADSYQLAKVTWLPDYLGNNKSHGSNRVDDGGKNAGNRNCETYGYVSECSSKKGTRIQVMPGLVCWKECQPLACADYGYVDSCPSPKTGKVITVGSKNCYFGCSCPSEYKYLQDVASAFNCKLGSQYCEESSCYGTGSGCRKYKECTCSSAYKYVEPNAKQTTLNGIARTKCSSPRSVGGDKCQTYISVASGGSTHFEPVTTYKECNCPTGQEYKNGACVPVCSDYPLTECPSPGGNCLECPQDKTKLKLVSCNSDGSTPDGGWCKDGNTCVPCGCSSTLYSAHISSCDRNSTKPHLFCENKYSGGKKCCSCICKTINTDCTATNYPLLNPPENAEYSLCATGCGSESVKRYLFIKCKDGYIDTDSYWCTVPSTDCASLGYTKTTSDCVDRKILKCPFDNSKLSCF